MHAQLLCVLYWTQINQLIIRLNDEQENRSATLKLVSTQDQTNVASSADYTIFNIWWKFAGATKCNETHLGEIPYTFKSVG